MIRHRRLRISSWRRKRGLTMPGDIAAQWQRFIELWNTQNIQLADEVAAAELVYHAPPFPDADLAGLKDMVMQAGDLEDFQVVSHEDVVMGDRSAHRWTASGRWTKPADMIPGNPTGNKIRAEGAHVCHWRDGKLVEAWHIGDWLGWYQTAGAQLP